MSKQTILARGAEATIYKSGSKQVIKDRVPKGYRHPELDKKLRTRRTRAETKLLTKASKIIPTPKILDTDNFKITMDYVPGKRLSDNLDNLKPAKITLVCKLIGKNIALLHNAGLIHGDLTTSNMILSNSARSPTIFFIDFGLGFHSDRIEDKAVDLHLISQALQAKHSKIYKKAFSNILIGYKKSKNYSKTIKQLEKVERRGRYKTQY